MDDLKKQVEDLVRKNRNTAIAVGVVVVLFLGAVLAHHGVGH